MKNADTQSPLNCVPLVDENHSGTLKKVNHQLSIEMLFHLAKVLIITSFISSTDTYQTKCQNR